MGWLFSKGKRPDEPDSPIDPLPTVESLLESGLADEMGRVEMTITTLTTPLLNYVCILILKTKESHIQLPIMMGAVESDAIFSELQNDLPPRPQTHDFANSIIATLKGTVLSAEISSLRKDTFYAGLRLRDFEGTERVVDARASDAIAIALRADAPIFATVNVLQQAGVAANKYDNGKRTTPNRIRFSVSGNAI